MRSRSGVLGALAAGGGCSSRAAAAGDEMVRGCGGWDRGPSSAVHPAAQHFFSHAWHHVCGQTCWDTHVDAHLSSLHSSL